MEKTYRLNLTQPPHIAWAGIGRHGHQPVERFLLPDLWCVHLFRDEMTLLAGENTFEVKPGQATIIPPAAPIEFHFARPCTHWHAFAHFTVEEPEANEEAASMPPIQSLGNRFEPLFAQMEQVINLHTQCTPRAQASLWNVLWELSRRDEQPVDALVRRAQELIERRLSESFRIPEIAAALGVSHNHLTRHFRAQTGQSVVEFVRARRVARARHLLQHSTLPIKVIATQVGLGDYHAFNKAIRNVTGRSPRAWRSDSAG